MAGFLGVSDCIAWMLYNHRIYQDGKDTEGSLNTIPCSLEGCLKVNHASKSIIQTLWHCDHFPVDPVAMTDHPKIFLQTTQPFLRWFSSTVFQFCLFSAEPYRKQSEVNPFSFVNISRTFLPCWKLLDMEGTSMTFSDYKLETLIAFCFPSSWVRGKLQIQPSRVDPKREQQLERSVSVIKVEKHHYNAANTVHSKISISKKMSIH